MCLQVGLRPSVCRPLACLAVFCSLLFAVSVRAEPITVGYYVWPPHVMTVNGKADGVAVRYFKLVAEESGWTDVRFQSYPFKRLLDKLADNSIEIALFLTITPERAAKFAYPKTPYHNASFSVAIAKWHRVQAVDSAAALHGLRVGYLKGAYRSPALQDERIKYYYFFGPDWAYRNLTRAYDGLLDAVLSDSLLLDYELRRIRYTKFFNVFHLQEGGIPIYSVMSTKFAEDHLSAYEAALSKVMQTVSYESIYETYVHDVVDGDWAPQ